MKTIYSIILISVLASCDNGLESNRSKSGAKEPLVKTPSQGQPSQSDDQIANRSDDAGASQDGLVMNLPDSISKKPIPEGAADPLKTLLNPGDIATMVPDLFAFASKLLPQGFFAPSPEKPGIPPYPCPAYHAENGALPGNHGFKAALRKITYECKSEEQTDGYYGYISSHISGSKIDHCNDGSYFGAERIKCKSFVIKLPPLKDGTFDLQAFFVSADKKSHYHGTADPKLTIESGKLTSNSKIIMKKKVTDSSGSVAVEFEE